ncbi:Rch1p KNAG_0M02280 [Huiozyma naganishii CBS 8797]|uniref:Uncharacterized protein n=1 Tax=Huiozyma naganishii (strain ATCC MYA-139 / BCRC 22969 / CBS 8797 / KCTC 17520 / NBRC 10181 / NCYC 3082 / Yp74L-3) TaxID=1071383 RepID=J7SBI9_HUIN7|nr:hypothetical protein KNAG_0M02280 [Kazachstania naganishii CBS 8797]CCK73081.1 hypothetical protein KNAG_0M02280 [Kazachstania naganishii CBS 8797]
MSRARVWFKRCWDHPVTQYVVSQWFFIWLAIFIVIARFAPNFARDGGLIRGQYSIGYGAVAWIFLQSGLSMKTSKIMANFANWRAHLTILVLSFLITSSIVYGFAVAIKVSNDKNIDDWVLIGLIMTATCPTTVASNVIMTANAGGNDLLCVCEVFIGNLLGGFITPALAQMFMKQYPFQYGNPANGNNMNDLYRRVMKQVGLSVFVPLFVGQVIQNVLPRPTKYYLDFLKRFHLKIGSYMLLLIMFSSFSTAFYQKSFTSVSHVCIIFLCFFNLGVYILFTGISFLLARPWFLIKLLDHEPDREQSTRLYYYSYKIFRPFYYNKRDAICIMFCGPAKTAALGVSLITSQYGDNKTNLGKILVSLVLYQAIQVLTASFFVPVFRKWAKDEIEAEERAQSELKGNKEQDLESGMGSQRTATSKGSTPSTEYEDHIVDEKNREIEEPRPALTRTLETGISSGQYTTGI